MNRTDSTLSPAALLSATLLVLALPAVALTLWKAAEWQNSVRQVMGLEPLDTAHPLQVGAVGLLVFLALLALARLFGVVMQLLRGRLKRLLPPRVAQVLATGLTVFAFWYVFNGVIFHQALRLADSSFRELDSHILSLIHI